MSFVWTIRDSLGESRILLVPFLDMFGLTKLLNDASSTSLFTVRAYTGTSASHFLACLHGNRQDHICMATAKGVFVCG